MYVLPTFMSDLMFTFMHDHIFGAVNAAFVKFINTVSV